MGGNNNTTKVSMKQVFARFRIAADVVRNEREQVP